MATVTNRAPEGETTNRSGKVRILDSNTDFEEMNAGHIIPGADPPKNEHQRGGFGDRDGRTGFGTDSADGATALSTNDDSEDNDFPTDGIQASSKLNSGTTTFALDDEDDEDDFADVDTDDDDDLDVDDSDIDITEIPDDDFDTDLDDDFEDEDDIDDLDLEDDNIDDDEDRF